MVYESINSAKVYGMIHYDIVTGSFVMGDEEKSNVGLANCTKLNLAVGELRGWLNQKRRNGQYSHGFLFELAVNSVNRAFHVQAIFDEIGKLEGTDARPSITKKARKMRPPLRGLWPKHFSNPAFIPKNLCDEVVQMAKDGRWDALFAPHYGKYSHEFINEVVYKVVIGAHQRRAQDRRITGEFIVFERQRDGSNYYLTLGKHGEWDAIRTRIDCYREFDASGHLP